MRLRALAGTARNPRLAGPLESSEALRLALAELRLLEGVDSLPVLHLEELRAVERALAQRLPDPLLALFAARVPSLETRFRLQLNGLLGLCGTLHALGVPGDRVAVGRDPSGAYLCLPRLEAAASPGGAAPDKAGSPSQEARAPQDNGCLVLLNPVLRSESPLSLLRFLNEQIASHREGHPEAPRARPGLAASFAPRSELPLPTASSGARVRHPKFGEGRVLMETGQGPTRKLKIDFQGAGLKIIQAKFITFL